LIEENKFYLVGCLKALVKFAGIEVVVNRFGIETWITLFELLIEDIGE